MMPTNDKTKDIPNTVLRLDKIGFTSSSISSFSDSSVIVSRRFPKGLESTMNNTRFMKANVAKPILALTQLSDVILHHLHLYIKFSLFLNVFI